MNDTQTKIGLPAIPSKWMLLLKSRKFWAAVVGLGLVIFRAYQPNFPIDDDQLTKIILVLIAYILGTALEDGVSVAASGAFLKEILQSHRDAELSRRDAAQSHGDASR